MWRSHGFLLAYFALDSYIISLFCKYYWFANIIDIYEIWLSYTTNVIAAQLILYKKNEMR